MRQSELFAKIKKEAPKDAESISHKYLARGDFIDQAASGIYSFLPLGWRVHKKIENIIRQEMLSVGGQEIFLPVLTPKKFWLETGRWQTIDPPLFKFKDRHGSELALGPTHEEIITDLVRRRVKSYRDLPLYLFQIQDKFRNEMRATGGLLRVREFIMKDLYSFHQSPKDAKEFYEKVKKAYLRIFKRCGLNPVAVEADPGTIGGEMSHEFMVLSETGEDKVLVCKKCGFAGNIEKFQDIKICPKCQSNLEKFSAIESAHAFYLGTKYSSPMVANFIDKKGGQNPVIMGCYGIGLGRLMATIIEANHDQRGIVWPIEVAPFALHLIPVGGSAKVTAATDKIYDSLKKAAMDVLYDDRVEKTPGEKFAEADLIGIPTRLVVSEKTLEKNSVEIKKRNEQKTRLVRLAKLSNQLLSLAKQ
ncbi:MAG: proline--tRNA ligase [Candidatus Nealsonbacteria bacterium]|nr:proline--tRNA ligase [Candidatus Nealsonbacteria bacterium]